MWQEVELSYKKPHKAADRLKISDEKDVYSHSQKSPRRQDRTP